MSISKCKWPSKLGMSCLLEPLLNDHLHVFIFKAGLLTPYASPPVFYSTICFSFARELTNYVLLILSKSSLMTIPASRGSFCSADVFFQIEDKSWFFNLFFLSVLFSFFFFFLCFFILRVGTYAELLGIGVGAQKNEFEKYWASRGNPLQAYRSH